MNDFRVEGGWKLTTSPVRMLDTGQIIGFVTNRPGPDLDRGEDAQIIDLTKAREKRDAA